MKKKPKVQNLDDFVALLDDHEDRQFTIKTITNLAGLPYSKAKEYLAEALEDDRIQTSTFKDKAYHTYNVYFSNNYYDTLAKKLDAVTKTNRNVFTRGELKSDPQYNAVMARARREKEEYQKMSVNRD